MALFPKNVVFRHSGNTFNGLKSYFAANPNEALRTGEIFVKYDNFDPDYASILTQDPRFNEPVSVFGNITQLIGVPESQRVWPYLSTIIYRESRLTEEYLENKIPYDPPQYVEAGPGWDVTNPFPYDLSASILDELSDVATEELIATTEGPLRSLQEGDTLSWKWIIGPEQTDKEADWRGYFQVGPGFGSRLLGIDASAKLNDTLSVTYPGGSAAIENNASLRWSQRDLQWVPKPVFPFLEGREDVTYGEDLEFEPEDGDGLKYDAVEEIWKPGDPISEGVVRISDARRATRDLEAIIITGQVTGWDRTSTYEAGQSSWRSPSTEINPLKKTYELSPAVQIRTKADDPSSHWDRFEDGAFYLPQQVPMRRGGSWREYIVPLSSEIYYPPLERAEKWEKGNGEYAIMTPPNLSSGLGTSAPEWTGDVTTQFWCKFTDDIYEVDLQNDNQFANPVRRGDRFYFFTQDRITFWVEYVRQGPLGGVFSLYCDYDANGSRPGLLVEVVASDVDYHICFQWDALGKRYKAWVNGVLVAQVNTRALGSTITFNPDAIEIGQKSESSYAAPSLWMADIVTTLTAENSKDFVAIFSGERDFSPPGPWGRQIVEGPKAALATLGITDTGYFNWVSKEVPYKWNTAFAGKQRFWIQEQLGWDASYFRGGEVLGWQDGRFATIPNAGGSDTKAKYSPGLEPKTPWIYSQIFNPDGAYEFQDPATGSFSPSLRFTNAKGINWKGTSWGYRYNTDSYSGDFGIGVRDFSMLGTPYISSKFRGKGSIYPSPVSSAMGGVEGVWGRGEGWEGLNEFKSGEKELGSLYDAQTDQGYNGSVIKFHVYDLNSIEYIFGGPYNDQNTLRVTVDNTGTVYVYLRHYQPYNTSSIGNSYADFAWSDGFRDYVSFNTKPGLIKSNSDHEIAIIQDFKNAEISLYVDGKKENLYDVSPQTGAYLIGDINDEGPGETTDETLRGIWCPKAVRPGSPYRNESWRNKSLPRGISIATGVYQVDGGYPFVRYSRWTGGLIAYRSTCLVHGFAIRWDQPDDYAAQDYYDFSGWYDVEARHVGQTQWSGAAHHRQEHSSFFQVSDLETTSAGTKTAQLNGHFVGPGRSINTMSLDYDTRYNSRNAFLRIDLQRDREEYEAEDWIECSLSTSNSYYPDGGSGEYYASGKQVDGDPYFQDVKSTATQWKTGDALTFRSGFWVAAPVDSTSAYNLADNEPVLRPFTDGDLLTYDERLAGYKNTNPGDFTYELDEISDVVITSPSSNDQLFYDDLTNTWSNKDLYYIERVVGLADVNIDTLAREEGALLGWDDSEKAYTNKYRTNIITLTDLEDVTNELYGQGSNWYIAWDSESEKWTGVSDGSEWPYWRGADGAWHTVNQDDYNIRRKLGRVFGVGSSMAPRFQTEYGTIAPKAFVESYQDSVNTGRGDGGNFEYGDIDMGMPLAIYGGGNFETGLEDAPREMIEGLDGGEFYLDNRRAMDVPTLRGYQFDPTELILYFDGEKPFLDNSLRVGQSLTYEGDLSGGATINATDGILEYPTFYWTEFYNQSGNRPVIPKFKGGRVEARYRTGSKLWMRNEPFSVEFDVRMDQPNTHDFVFFTKGDSAIKLSYRQRNWATMETWEAQRYQASDPEKRFDVMRFMWQDKSTLKWYIDMPVTTAPWVYGEFRHFVLAYAPDPGQISVYYNEVLVCTGLLEDALRTSGSISNFPPTGIVNVDWRDKFWINEYLGFGCDPYTAEDHLQGAIDNVRIMQHETPYDATSGIVPVATIPYPLNELPPVFDPSLSLADNTQLVVAMIEFPQDDGQVAAGISGVDSVGRLWEPNPFATSADEVTDPYDESVPYVSVLNFYPGFEFDPKGQSGYFNNPVSSRSNGWNGRCGLKTTLTPELDLRDKSFTIDTVISPRRTRFWDQADIEFDTPLTKELVEHSLILLNVASEENLSDVEAGRSWALRVLDFDPDSRYYNKEYDKGIRFEWWRDDDRGNVRYHNLDFWFGPECFSQIEAERYTATNQSFAHVIVQRDMTEGSLSVILNGARIKKFDPFLKESFRDVSTFTNPLMAVGMDANMNFDEGFDFHGYVSYLRILTGSIPWGQAAEFPYTKPDLSAN